MPIESLSTDKASNAYITTNTILHIYYTIQCTGLRVNFVFFLISLIPSTSAIFLMSYWRLLYLCA